MLDHGAHVLLTGGTGFFGIALLRLWRTMGKNAPTLTVLSRDPQRFRERHPDLHAMANWIHGDVLQRNSLPWELRFSHILHTATDSTLGPQLTPLQRYGQIVDGTRNVLELAVATGASRFLLTSSGGVYGPQPPGMDRIEESYLGMADPLLPANAYSVAKRSAEHMCALYQDSHGLEIVIARCFSFVGRDLPLDVHFAIGNFIRDALQRDEITVTGDGSALRSYMDQRDLAQWLLTLLEKGRAGHAYNVGSNIPIAIGELAYRIRDILAPNKKVKISGIAQPSHWRNRYIPSIDKAQSELGLRLEYSLDEALGEFHPRQ